ncbi:MAG: hypothetical protein PHF00_00150, partial [Elusimicrobia bacterium]|nr:hypothetical protein [Elusimicrobiota bacterium]
GRGLSPTADLPAAWARLVAEPGNGSLWDWMERMRRDAQEQALALPGGARANVLVLREGRRSLALADFGGHDPVQGGRIAAAGLRAAVRAFLDSDGHVVAADRQVLARWSRDGRAAKLYGNIDASDLGGSVFLLYEDAAGVERQAAALSALGFRVEVRGRALSAAFDGSFAAADAAGVEEAFVRAAAALSG